MDIGASPHTVSGNVSYSDNRLNQYTSVAGVTPAYDTRGNLTGDGARTYQYDIYNRLVGVNNGALLSLEYDAAGRILRTSSAGATTRFLHDGANLIGEYDSSGTTLRRYVHGPGVDEPIVWYEGTGVSDRRWLVADERGSVVAVTNGSGAVTEVYSYDEFGTPNNWSGSRFRYTGQIMLPEAQLYHYKARAYSPTLGRFLQTDPIGFGGGDLNLYAYVSNDPVNFTDPFGLEKGAITVNGTQPGFVSFDDSNPYSMGGTASASFAWRLGAMLAYKPPRLYGPLTPASPPRTAPPPVEEPEIEVRGRRDPGRWWWRITPVTVFFTALFWQAPSDECQGVFFAPDGRPCPSAANDNSRREECDQQAESDEAICRALPNVTREDRRLREQCWSRVPLRYGECMAGRPLPDLLPGR